MEESVHWQAQKLPIMGSGYPLLFCAQIVRKDKGNPKIQEIWSLLFLKIQDKFFQEQV